MDFSGLTVAIAQTVIIAQTSGTTASTAGADPFAVFAPPLISLGISIMHLIVAVGIVATAVTGVQFLWDRINGNVMAQRQHKGQLIGILGTVFAFGSASLIVQLVTGIAGMVGGA